MLTCIPAARFPKCEWARFPAAPDPWGSFLTWDRRGVLGKLCIGLLPAAGKPFLRKFPGTPWWKVGTNPKGLWQRWKKTNGPPSRPWRSPRRVIGWGGPLVPPRRQSADGPAWLWPRPVRRCGPSPGTLLPSRHLPPGLGNGRVHGEAPTPSDSPLPLVSSENGPVSPQTPEKALDRSQAEALVAQAGVTQAHELCVNNSTLFT